MQPLMLPGPCLTFARALFRVHSAADSSCGLVPVSLQKPNFPLLAHRGGEVYEEGHVHEVCILAQVARHDAAMRLATMCMPDG